MVRHTLQTLRCEHRKFFLKYVWSFIKIMHEGFKLPKGVATVCELSPTVQSFCAIH